MMLARFCGGFYPAPQLFLLRYLSLSVPLDKLKMNTYIYIFNAYTLKMYMQLFLSKTQTSAPWGTGI